VEVIGRRQWNLAVFLIVILGLPIILMLLR
jgi:hypothetical protein